MSEVARLIKIVTNTAELNGWKRVNGNTWAKPTGSGQWELRTGYVHGEATLRVRKVTGGKTYYYRGADPVRWVSDELSKVRSMDFAKALAVMVSHE